MLFFNKQGGINPLKLLKEMSSTSISVALQIKWETSPVRLLFANDRELTELMRDQKSGMTEELKWLLE
jgi:hypothetical protein